MSALSFTSYLSHQIAHTDDFTESAALQTVQRVTLGMLHMVDSKKPSSTAIQLAKDRAATPAAPTPTLSPPTISSLINTEKLILPTRLASFLTFTSRFSHSYASNFYAACTDLAILETISLTPRGEREDEIQDWIEEQIPLAQLGYFKAKKRNMLEKVMLETVIGGVQIGLVMGMGTLRNALEELDAEWDEVGGEAKRSSASMKSGDKKRLEEWITEGVDFIADLEVLKEVIGERYAGPVGDGYKKLATDMCTEGIGSQSEARGESGSPESFVSVGDESKVYGPAPAIPERSSKRMAQYLGR